MRWVVLSTVFVLISCTYPVEQTRTLDERPSVIVQGAPAGALLIVDGLNAGTAVTIGGVAQAIRIEPGTHMVEVVADGRILLQEKIYVNGAVMKTLSIQSGSHLQ